MHSRVKQHLVAQGQTSMLKSICFSMSTLPAKSIICKADRQQTSGKWEKIQASYCTQECSRCPQGALLKHFRLTRSGDLAGTTGCVRVAL